MNVYKQDIWYMCVQYLPLVSRTPCGGKEVVVVMDGEYHLALEKVSDNC